MAIKATVFKASINIADMDRHYYDDHTMTIARHPSESDLRMMTRIAVFALNADPKLTFTKGISTDDEPDLWKKSLSGEIECWIELGQPDEKRLRQACGKAKEVKIYCYSGRGASVWWEQIKPMVKRFNNLSIVNLNNEQLEQLNSMAQRTMDLHCSIQYGELSVSDGRENATIEQHQWYPLHE